MRFVAEWETGKFPTTHETDASAAGARALMPRCRIANFRLKFIPNHKPNSKRLTMERLESKDPTL